MPPRHIAYHVTTSKIRTWTPLENPTTQRTVYGLANGRSWDWSSRTGWVKHRLLAKRNPLSTDSQGHSPPHQWMIENSADWGSAQVLNLMVTRASASCRHSFPWAWEPLVASRFPKLECKQLWMVQGYHHRRDMAPSVLHICFKCRFSWMCVMALLTFHKFCISWGISV